MYSPELNRFLSRDPKGYIDGINLYAYVKNNPLKYLDPMGLTARATETANNNSEDPNNRDKTAKKEEDSHLSPFEAINPSRLFEYGNWGGEFRSGGKTTKRGEIGPLDVKGIDQMDQGGFRTHDIAVYEAEHRELIYDPDDKKMIKQIKKERDTLVIQANKDLLQYLKNLPDDPRQWNPPASDPEKAEKFRDKAIWLFSLD